jgi:hypothetical protein
VPGTCADGKRTTFAFVLKEGFALDRVEVESNERHEHRQEKTSQHVRSRLIAYQFAIHGYSSGWGMSGRLREVDSIMQELSSRLWPATSRKLRHCNL